MTDQDEGFRVTDRRGHAKDDSSPATIRPLAAEPAEPAAPPPDLASLPGDLRPLVVMLANFALLALEPAPDPGTGEPQIDLAQAEDAIQGLLTVRDRTEGRRTAEETELFERALHQIQLRYAEIDGPPPRH